RPATVAGPQGGTGDGADQQYGGSSEPWVVEPPPCRRRRLAGSLKNPRKRLVRHLIGSPGGGEQLLERGVVHWTAPSSSVTQPVSRGSRASRRRPSCSRDFTVPGRRWIAVAISRS